ncbi:MAG: SPOR domain-containing protein [Magnetococcus sp. YQC-3]
MNHRWLWLTFAVLSCCLSAHAASAAEMHAGMEASAGQNRSEGIAPAGRGAAADVLQEVFAALIEESDRQRPVGTDFAEGNGRGKGLHSRGKFAFKVESFRESANADKALGSATRLKLPVYVEVVDVNQLPHIRVWVGPFDNSSTAEAARQKMTAEGYHPGTVNQF